MNIETIKGRIKTNIEYSKNANKVEGTFDVDHIEKINKIYRSIGIKNSRS